MSGHESEFRLDSQEMVWNEATSGKWPKFKLYDQSIKDSRDIGQY